MSGYPGRRAVLAGLAGLFASRPGGAQEVAPLRLAVVPSTSMQWIGEIISRHKLDRKYRFTLSMVTVETTDAGRQALAGGSADVVVSDWLFVAAQRANGTMLCFAPLTNALGGVMTVTDAEISGPGDLRGRRLGVTGDPAGASWLLVQAATRGKHGVDLTKIAEISYGSSSALRSKLRDRAVDAVLADWDLAARLGADGFAEPIAVARCAVELGLPARLNLEGMVFREEWAKARQPVIDGFLAAVDEANRLLTYSDTEWPQVRSLMRVANDDEFRAVTQRFGAGIGHPNAQVQEEWAAKTFAALRQSGVFSLGENRDNLPPGIFWPVRWGPG